MGSSGNALWYTLRVRDDEHVTVTADAFLKDYSRLLRAGLASVFVGAGISRDSGLPTWDDLLAPPILRGARPRTVVVRCPKTVHRRDIP